MTSPYDAIVIGGGVVGAATGYHLVQDGARTLLIDRNDVGRATSAGAGILAPEISLEQDAWFHFATAAVAYYPTLLAELAAVHAGDTGYSRCGLLRVAATEDEIAPYDEAERLILARQRQRGAPAADILHPVTPNEAKQLFPALGQVKRALYFRDGARVDGRLLAAALRRAAVTHGLETLDAGVDELIIEQKQVCGVQVQGEAIAAKSVVIAGGAWSATFGDQLGLRIPVEPQRGQIIHLDLPGAATGDWPVVNAFHGHYIVCWPGDDGSGRVVVGATRETGAGFAPHTTAAGVIEVLSEALRVAPGLAEASIHEIRVGLRPRTADNLPVLCAAPTVQGVVIACGHGATGLQLGPFSGKIAAALALGKPAEVDIRALDIQRFG